jgi:NlpC/P60 family putative phage cell wall peptidase
VSARVVAEARGWIGTPYLHGASVQGAGCDCLGLLRGVWRVVEGAEPVVVPRYSADWDEPQRREVLRAAAQAHLIEVAPDAAKPGDVILFRMRAGAVAKHLGIQSEVGPTPRFVHAYAGHGVVENALSGPWARRIVARFRFPSVTALGGMI